MKRIKEENMTKGVDEIFGDFMNSAKEKKEAEKIEKEQSEKIRTEKAIILKPVRKLLKMFTKNKLIVKNTNTYKKIRTFREDVEPVVFAVLEGESSPSWSPGTSLFFDHPSEVEIAVPNVRNRSKEGLIVIRCSNGHPLSEKINNTKYETVEKACEAISELLINSLVSINTNDE